MKKIFKFLVILLLMTSCSKEGPTAESRKNVSGNYEADVHYYQERYGLSIDTSYKTTFEITQQHSDTINVGFQDVFNGFSKEKLYFMPNQTSQDTLEYESNNNPGYWGARFSFYKRRKKFLYKYNRPFIGVSGPGSLTYTVSN